MEATINAVDCDAVIVGTPIDLARVIEIEKPSTRVYYDLQEIGAPTLDGIVSDFIAEHVSRTSKQKGNELQKALAGLL